MRVGVVIGRFQSPYLHAGHQQFLQTVMRDVDQLVVFIGVSPIDQRCAENTLSWEQRKHILSDVVISPRGHILPLFDCRTNEEWTARLDAQLESMYPTAEITLYAGRDSGFANAYSGRYPIIRIELDEEIRKISATNIRRGFTAEYDTGFMSGQTYALNHQYPKSYSTVDMAHVRKSVFHTSTNPLNWFEVVVIQRKDTGIYCFPGGFVDPTDQSLEYAAKRELLEETGLVSEAPMEYICSRFIDDWRYRSSRDKIITSFWLSRHSHGFPDAGDDAAEAKWVTLYEAKTLLQGSQHEALLDVLIARLLKESNLTENDVITTEVEHELDFVN